MIVKPRLLHGSWICCSVLFLAYITHIETEHVVFLLSYRRVLGRIFLKKLEVPVNDLLYMFLVMPNFLGIWMYCWSCWEFGVYLLAELIIQMLGFMYKSLEYYSMFTWNAFLDWKWSKREYIGIEFGLILCLCCKLYLT